MEQITLTKEKYDEAVKETLRDVITDKECIDDAMGKLLLMTSSMLFAKKLEKVLFGEENGGNE